MHPPALSAVWCAGHVNIRALADLKSESLQGSCEPLGMESHMESLCRTATSQLPMKQRGPRMHEGSSQALSLHHKLYGIHLV
jgi:hypothetical protein